MYGDKINRLSLFLMLAARWCGLHLYLVSTGLCLDGYGDVSYVWFNSKLRLYLYVSDNLSL